jgi:hypothetical protein
VIEGREDNREHRRDQGHLPAGAHPLPAEPGAGQVVPDPDLIGIGLRWARSQSGTVMPVLATIAGAAVLYLSTVFNGAVRAGWASVYQVPLHFAQVSPEVGTVWLFVLAAVVVAVLTFLLLFLDALLHRGMRPYLLGFVFVWAAVVRFFEAPLQAWWRTTLAIGVAALAVWGLFEVGALASKVLRRMRPPQHKPRWMPAGAWEWVRVSRPLRGASNLATTIVLWLLLAPVAAWGTAIAGHWAGQNWLAGAPGAAWVMEDTGSLGPGTQVVVFLDGDLVLERPVTRADGEDDTYVPCGSITIRPLGDAGVRLRLEEDFGTVVLASRPTMPCPVAS